MGEPLIIVAGAYGNLGKRIVRALRNRGAAVRALVRHGAPVEKVAELRQWGVDIAEGDLSTGAGVAAACAGGTCVVSALLGMRDVMVDAQTRLLEGAQEAGVGRFIPSDYAMDFTKLVPGNNRNLDLHRDFAARLDAAPIAATSILNGAFMDMLTGQAPLILFGRRRVLYWHNADQPMDFTTTDDTAEYTALAALDPDTPRYLRIAGEQLTARQLAALMTEITGRKFRLMWAGNLRTLGLMIKVARIINPAPRTAFPAWQGMQYMRDMFAGRAAFAQLDNARYPAIRWTSARTVLQKRGSVARSN